VVSAFLRGLRISVQRPHFAIAIWLVQAALAAALALPISNFLHRELNRSPDAAVLVRGPDAVWWTSVRRAHPDVVGDLPEAAEGLVSVEGSPGLGAFDRCAGIGATLLGLGLLAILLHAYLLGGIFGTLHDDGPGDLTTVAREGARRLPAFLIVTVGAAALCALLYHSVYVGSGRLLTALRDGLPTERQALLLTAGRFVALLALLTLVKLGADSIRIALVERPDLPPVTRYIVGLGSAIARLPALMASLVLYSGSVGVLYFLWSRLSIKSAATTTGGVALLVAAGQVFLLLRAFLKVAYYAGVREALLRPAGRPQPEPAPAAE
jgi:hypothetical protein